MITSINAIQNDLWLLKQWYMTLDELQKDHIALQVTCKLPFLVMDSRSITSHTFISLFEIHKERYPPNVYLEKAFLTLLSLEWAIEKHISDYPANTDEYLDWFSKRPGLYDFVADDLIRYGFSGDPAKKNELIEFHMRSIINAKTTWEKTKHDFINLFM